MILEEETYKRYGYYPRDLKRKSGKTILAVCDTCGKIRETSKNAYCALCKGCSKKGKPCTEETKRKIGEANKGKQRTKEVKRKLSELQRGEKGPNWQGGEIKRKCEVCGKSFSVKRAVVRYGQGRFCSQKCMGIAFSNSHRDKNNSNWNGGKVKRKCAVCGKEFETMPSQIKKGWGKYCSTNCMGVAYSTKWKGEDNPNWKGGISFEPYCHKFNKKFKNYIRAKFGNVCYLCGKTVEENGENLSIHHVNYNKACGCANTKEDRKTDNNECQFVPLCRSCNSKMNKNRDYWENHIKNKMKNKLNGWYI
jgi:hypothetical protein